MTIGSIALKRRHVLGDLYSKCDRLESVPVYMEEKTDEPIGHLDESLGVFTDAFLFHLPEDICKKLGTSHYKFGFNYNYSGKTERGAQRINLNYILLLANANSLPRRAATSKAPASEAVEKQLA